MAISLVGKAWKVPQWVAHPWVQLSTTLALQVPSLPVLHLTDTHYTGPQARQHFQRPRRWPLSPQHLCAGSPGMHYFLVVYYSSSLEISFLRPSRLARTPRCPRALITLRVRVCHWDGAWGPAVTVRPPDQHEWGWASWCRPCAHFQFMRICALGG